MRGKVYTDPDTGEKVASTRRRGVMLPGLTARAERDRTRGRRPSTPPGLEREPPVHPEPQPHPEEGAQHEHRRNRNPRDQG